MSMPDLPVVCQINFPDTDQAPPWSDAVCNAVAHSLRSFDFEERAFRSGLRSDRLTLGFADRPYDLVPGKGSSAYAPHVRLSTRVRLLRQTAPSSGVFLPWWFGYLDDFQPQMTKATPVTNTLVARGPLAAIADMPVKLSPSIGAVVWDADDPFHTGLWHLLNEAGLYGTAFLQLDNVGAVTLPDDWAGTGAPDIADPANWAVKGFGEWLAILTNASKCMLAVVPLLAVNAGDPDFALHWYQTLPSADADFTLDATAGELELTPQLTYNGQVPG